MALMFDPRTMIDLSLREEGRCECFYCGELDEVKNMLMIEEQDYVRLRFHARCANGRTPHQIYQDYLRARTDVLLQQRNR